MAFILWSVARVQDNGSGLATVPPLRDLEFRAGTILPQGQWEGERAPEFGRGAGHSVVVPSSGFGEQVTLKRSIGIITQKYC